MRSTAGRGAGRTDDGRVRRAASAVEAGRRAGGDNRGTAKSGGLLREGERSVSEVYAFIEAEKTTHIAALLCRLLKVARSSFYAWLPGEKNRRAKPAAVDALVHEITVLHLASRGAYGLPRIHAGLRRLGHRNNRKRIERVMCERGISGVTRRKRRGLNRPAKRAVPAPDLLGRDFTASAPGMNAVGDITYIPTDEGWLYLATWLDLATREIVGYSMVDHHRASVVVDALRMAVGRSRLQPGRIAHSDRGSEHTSNSAVKWASWDSSRAWDAPARASTVSLLASDPAVIR
ncbi:IS3 family transposase [Streptomyces sp. NPDC090080]|uniref:IS3 family transposase n=1 Tax=Streptomyces sp. NPDC090080 TaxID=3365939 RepID=UPI003824E7BF